jgi:mono/diheme cytochrome c family protein
MEDALRSVCFRGLKGRARRFVRAAVFLLTASVICTRAATAPTAEQIEFFEEKIRPVFAEHCYTCHSDKAEKVKGGLRLDTREALLKGGDSGPVIVPGNPDASLMIKAVRYEDKDLQMPPKNKKLSGEQIAALEDWVKMGAPDPRAAARPPPLTDIGAARARHWAFQPVKNPVPPPVKKKRWVQTPIDNFVLAKLEQKHLHPAPPADRRTLIRRVTYDLLGLPPTPEEVETFVKDKRPNAYALLVDRLLASPHYGERWGRYWLDVARYADTKGYLAGGEERRYAFSYTYRDYVVRAFNEDKPYDQFLVEQIAADQLVVGENPAKRDTLAALGFLTLGRRFLNNQNDIIDDRIDVVTRGTLGLTVSCARCHDHKFDPIPTKDYYALHGVFASSEEPSELPLLGPLEDSPQYQDYLKEKAKIQKEIEEFEDKEIAKFIADLRLNVGDYLLGARDAGRLGDKGRFDTFASERKLIPAVLRRWMTDLEARRKNSDPIFTPWFELSAFAEEEFSTNSQRWLAKLTADSVVNAVVRKALSGPTTNSLKQVVEAYNKLFKGIDAEWKTNLTVAAKEKKPAPVELPDADREALRKVLYADGTPINLPKDEVRTIHARRLREGAAPIRNKIEALSWTHPGVPQRAMALADRSNPGNSHVFMRGNPGSPGPEVPRRFLEVLSEPDRPPFTNGSGRLELARAIVSHDNPLTARVYVNRVWLHHFGEGLVGTPGDFGVRTEAPLHRDLLDYLATAFRENGWSTKKLHRLILLSATYQQSSEVNSRCLKADPDNRYLHHVNRRRLDFEAMRDTLLAVSGKLDLKMGGVPVDIVTEPFPPRRTIYGLIDRQNLPSLFRTFDFANPDTSNQGRFYTTVPQQALFMMNSPFVIEQARSLVKRDEVERVEGQTRKIQALHRLVWQRPADSGEFQLAEKFIASQPEAGANLSPLEKYAQVLLLSNELMFVD